MFELNRTKARHAFKDLLGQANHFLITILVGLNGVRSNQVTIDSEFNTSWNPKNKINSADRSRQFALDMGLVRAVDALDTYMMMSARKPRSIEGNEFRSAMDGTGKSVSKRLTVFCDFLTPLQESHKEALHIAIDWRNRRVHSLARDTVENSALRTVNSDAERFKSSYSGLCISEFVRNYRSNLTPSFKETAAIIRMTHEAVEIFDQKILENLDVERYLTEFIALVLGEDKEHKHHSTSKIWGSDKKEDKVIRLLRLAGVNSTEFVKGREISQCIVDRFVGLSVDDARSRF